MLVSALVSTLVLLSAPGGGPAAFTEEAATRGLFLLSVPGTGIAGAGNGLAFADLDDDGDPDVVMLGARELRVTLRENDGAGSFVDHTAGSGLPTIPQPTGVLVFDYDGDGDLDVYVGQANEANVLGRNDGGFVFTDVSAASGLDDAGPSGGATAGDYDGDGWLDVHVPNYGSEDRLFHNLGGTFVDVAPSMGLDDPSRGWQSAFFDKDLDGDADLYVSNDKKVPEETTMTNHLYENVGGVFVDVSTPSGTAVNMYSMGIGVGDFDRNGYQDLYCTNLSLEPNVLLANVDGAQFQDQAAAWGVTTDRKGWAGVFFDFDNDGHLDLFNCNEGDPNRLYTHGGSFPAVDLAPAVGLDLTAQSYCAATADLENDGDLDLLVQANFVPVKLYVNHEGETRNWVEFRVRGRAPNVFAIGARVELRTGSVWQVREVLAGSNSFLSQNDTTLHFGLGTAGVVDEVVVTWPGGESAVLTDLGVNQIWTVAPDLVAQELQGGLPR